MKRLAVLLAVLLITLAAPGVATAQFGPQNVPGPLAQPDPAEAEAPEEEETGLTTLQLVLIFGAAIGAMGIVAWFIMRDAHRVAPAAARAKGAKPERGQPPEEPAATTAAKSARERERERARKRNKAKAVRDQRKRNRPR